MLEDFIEKNVDIFQSTLDKIRRMGTESRILSVNKVLVWLFFIFLMRIQYRSSKYIVRYHNSIKTVVRQDMPGLARLFK